MTKIIANLKGDFAIMASQDVIDILAEMNKAEGFQRERLTLRASELHNSEQNTEDWLAGYAAQMIVSGQTKGVAKVRKSEARQVFNAFHTAYLASNLDTDEARRDAAMQQLSGLQCGYHAFIEQCRKIAQDGQTTSNSSSRAGTIKKMQSDDVQKIVKRLEVSGASVALETAKAGIMAYVKQAGTPIGIVRQMEILAHELQKSAEPYYKKIGDATMQMCEDAVARDAKENAKAPATKPTPATAAGSTQQQAAA